MSEGKTQHRFVLRVEDEPLALDRVASLFRRRGFRIEWLTLGPDESEGVRRITIVTRVAAETAPRVEAHLHKLVNVLSVENVTHAAGPAIAYMPVVPAQSV